MKKGIKIICLHLKLEHDYMLDYEKRMLKRYGESSTGSSISRDILIPSDMPLHNLHYAIQKLFGWQNSHLRRFYLPEHIYNRLTQGTVKGWSDLVGILFQPPSEMEEEIFWDDDYNNSASISTWLRKKYTGPYVYGGSIEHTEAARKDLEDLLDKFSIIDVMESFSEYWERSKVDKDTEMRILRKAALIDLTLEEMHASLDIGNATENILERLEVDKVLAAQGESFSSEELFPVTDELIYNYDFASNWIVKITRHKDYSDLLEENLVDKMEIEKAEELVISKHKPVCISKDGLSVFDDVGNLSGFANFLGFVYEGDDKGEMSDRRAWARSLGWNTRKFPLTSIL